MKRKAFLILAVMVFLCPRAWAEGQITREEVLDAQKEWAAAVVAIGKAWQEKGDYRQVAERTVDELYGYEQGQVLFKPTKAKEEQFRNDKQGAVSYFVGGGVAEDKGFALQPWSAVRFGEQEMAFHGDVAVAMGNYFFTDASTGRETKVEFTFGYFEDQQGRIRIFLHHSSLPYAAKN